MTPSHMMGEQEHKVKQWVKSLFTTLAPHPGVPVRTPEALLLMQPLAVAPGKAVGNGPSA